MYIYNNKCEYIATFSDEVVFPLLNDADKKTMLQMYADCNRINRAFGPQEYPVAQDQNVKREVCNVASRFTGQYQLECLPGKIIQPLGGSTRTAQEFIKLKSEI